MKYLFFCASVVRRLPEVYAKTWAGRNENVNYVLTEVGMR